MLADYLSNGNKRALMNSAIRPGCILCLNCADHVPDHDKYIVIAYEERSLLHFFFINSRIHSEILKDAEKHKCQVSLSPDEYPFLAHDSYLNCADVERWFTRDEAVRQLVLDPARLKDDLSQTTKEAVVRIVNDSKLYSRVTKGKIEASLLGG